MAWAKGEAFDAELVALFPLAGFAGDAAVVLDHELNLEVGCVELFPSFFGWDFGANPGVVLFGDVDMP